MNPVVTVGDLDGDGSHDLILADQSGRISIYPDFRNFDPQVDVTIDEVIHNDLVDAKASINLGGRAWPAIVNLFNSDKPAIVVGNTTGGLRILRNRDGSELPEEPVITVYPNPVMNGDSLKVLSDRAAEMQVFSTLGQKMSEPIPVPANQSVPVALRHLASGVYIARFAIKGKNYSRRFVLYWP